MKIFRGGETEKLTPKKLSLLPRESTQCFGEVQNFTRKRYYYCLFFPIAAA